jgi:acylphosphatase
MVVSKHIVYHGRVQGVGFRYVASQTAAEFEVSGYVRNLANGGVELVAEGTKDEVEAYLASISRRMAAYIEDTTVKDETLTGYSGFKIRYG